MEKDAKTAEQHWKTDSHIEDRALKLAAQFFGAELFPLMGIQGRAVRPAPTEQIHLEVKDFNEDFNYEMEDGSWVHLEFESDQITQEDLRRFRSYEAISSYYYKVDVKTYVICSCRVKKIRSTLQTGMNNFQVHVIRMKDHNADQLVETLEKKQKSEPLERNELVQLLLTPLMSGSMPQKDRVGKGLELLKKEHTRLGDEDFGRMEAVLYAFALKFLNMTELKEIKEVMRMSPLGQMLREDGILEGVQIGMKTGIQTGIQTGIKTGRKTGEICQLLRLTQKKMAKGYSADETAEILEIDVGLIRRLYKIIESNPGNDVEGWCAIYQKESGEISKL